MVLMIEEALDEPRDKHTICVNMVSKHPTSANVIVMFFTAWHLSVFENLQLNGEVAAFKKEA